MSFITTLSASATVVDVAEVPPSIIFSSAAVEVIFVPPISRVVAWSSPATVTRPFATVIKSVSSVWPIVVPSMRTLSISRDPPEINPVVVIVEDPVSIDPNPEVIDPEFNAPTVVAAVVTKLGIAVISSSKYAARSVTATCTIVPLSFSNTLSASATVVEVAEVSPLITLRSFVLVFSMSPLLALNFGIFQILTHH